MDTPAAVLGLVLLMTGVGASVPLWSVPTWGRVRHGFELLTGATVLLLVLGARASLAVPLSSALAAAPGSASRFVAPALVTMLVATGVALAVLALRLPAVLARVAGTAATLAGLASFVPLAGLRAERGGPGGLGQGLVELLLGATLLGGVWFAMILGHWYLVERRLSNGPMVRVAWANAVGVLAGLASVLLSWRSPAPCADLEAAAFQQCATLFAPVLRIGSMTVVLGLGVLALVALIAAFNVRLAREGGRSIQAATGMSYLAVVLAPAVEFAAKVRYF